MDLLGRVLVVLGFAAGAVTGAMVVAALMLPAGGADVHAHVDQVLRAVGAVVGALFGARVNRASALALAAERG